MIKNDKAIVDKKEVWDRDWQEIDDRYFWYGRYRHRIIGNYVRDMKGGVLDLGCGLGYMAYYMRPNAELYTGVDISPIGIEKATTLFPEANFAVHDISKKLPFPDKSFDNVICTETLEHLEDFKPTLKEMKRIAVDKILITVPVSMGEADHVYPVWTYKDLVDNFDELGKILVIERNFQYHFNLVLIDVNGKDNPNL